MAESSPELEAVRSRLVQVVRDHARDPNNPWAITHAILALGPDVRLTNGQDAVDWLFQTYATVQRTADGQLIRFPAERGKIRIEPHTDLVLKALTEAGLAPDRVVVANGRTLNLGDLYRGSLRASWVDGDQVSLKSWNNTPWALQAQASWAPAGLVWTASGGHPMTLDGFTHAVLTQLRHETAFMRDARAKGELVQKRGQGIFAYTCGGAHLLQGVAYAVGRGFGEPGDAKAVAEEVDILYWRVDIELAAVDDALVKHPTYALVLLEQRLKFLGHFLETAHKLAAMGLYQVDEGKQIKLAEANQQLIKTVQEIERMGVFDKLGEVRENNEQVYLDFVGDSAHAVRGIDMATGRGVVRW